MGASLKDQAERLYHLFSNLVRRYQFRDRDRICCHGLSISQCYALETLDREGLLSMRDLAGRLQLEISTMTRVVDHLVVKRLAKRVEDPKDRRVCRVQITGRGRTLAASVQAELVEEYECVLRAVPPESREAVIQTISLLLAAFKERQQCRAAEAGDARPGRHKVG